MNVLIINGSPRADGTTARLIDAFRNGLPENACVAQLDLYSVLPMPCVACGACMRADTCRFSDLEDAHQLLIDADVLVWALPVYNYSVPAPVKAFLDRFQRYYEAKETRGESVFFDRERPCLLLLSAGRSGLYSVDIIKKQLSTACSYIGFSLRETVFAAHTDTQALSQDVLNQTAQLAASVC